VEEMKLLILGGPGAGKGTQAIKIARKYKIAHIASGDILREGARSGADFGMEASRYMAEGDLVPDILILNLMLKRLRNDDCKNGFILDGFPRTIYQAMEFHRTHEIDLVINIIVDKEILVERISGRRSCPSCGQVYHISSNPPEKEGVCDRCGTALIQRKDDTEETLLHRYAIYQDEIKPLIEFYSRFDNIIDINGDRTIEEIQAEIDGELSRLTSQ
jgi:adenylate kinase